MKKRFSIVILIIASLAVILPLFVFAQAKLSISASLPGTNVTGSTASPGAYIANFYQLALMLGGILAFGAIVWGGIKYATSAGNSEAQSDGKAWIKAALLGLLLLAGAYLVLFTINPNLVNLNLPTPSGIANGTYQAVSGAPSTGGTGNTPNLGCAAGQCTTLPNCTPVPGTTNCGGAVPMKALLNCIDQTDNSYTVNEGYPPIGSHSDPGHNDGCAIDVHTTSCAAGAAFMAAAQNCGASKVLNEYTSCGGSTYKHTSGGNIHIDAPKGSGC